MTREQMIDEAVRDVSKNSSVQYSAQNMATMINVFDNHGEDHFAETYTYFPKAVRKAFARIATRERSA